MDRSPPDSSVHEISQARILECVAISSSRGSFPPRNQTPVSCVSKWILYHWATWEAPEPLYHTDFMNIKECGCTMRVISKTWKSIALKMVLQYVSRKESDGKISVLFHVIIILLTLSSDTRFSHLHHVLKYAMIGSWEHMWILALYQVAPSRHWKKVLLLKMFLNYIPNIANVL